MTFNDALPEGMYESLLTARLEELLAERPDDTRLIYDVDGGDEPHVLARHVRNAVERALSDEKDPTQRRDLVNRILTQLGNETDLLGSSSRQLHFLHRPAGPGVEYIAPDRPSTPLSDAALLTNATGEPSLGSELRAELETADSVDLLIAFVKWYGLRLLEPQLRRLRDRGIPLRVITTTYMGATERQALDRLVNQFGAEVKIQYDVLRTRLHAKAWLFNRRTGFNTAYVGSSNLSRAALLDGVEWNVRLSAVATPALMHKFEATFETYWNDSSFEDYDPDRDRDRLDDALLLASGGGSKQDQVTISISGLDVQPFPYQAEMLESLDVERVVHDRHNNLVVAATGTGKTVLAALDYRRLSQSEGRAPRLLFVAHRQEILTQSLRTYREVLRDQDFGELYVGGARPERWEHVFASVQSLNSYGVSSIPADHFEVVVIDEFHHAQARTYRTLLDHLEPSELLGLTATPERADGTDVAQTFFDGRIAAELRLWDALASELLSPFHYFGIADGTDLSAITWKRGAYSTEELERVYTGNDARAALILQAVRDKIVNPRTMKALGFCVSVAHAEYMARVFTDAGIPAAAVTSDPRSTDRAEALADVRAGRLAVVFTVDMFNEGIDLPSVDTVLFLRPTESATVFLQQLGRGLRRADDKAVLTALDFVGHQNKSFRFADRFRAMTGSTRKGLADQVDKGFPFLPSGCQIVLDQQTQDVVLDNLKGQLTTRWKALAAELKKHPTDELSTYLGSSTLSVVLGAHAAIGHG
ncbi:MAG: DEAD/DEAH box helicase family protein, partial [Nocardioidaceae bacterium]|nr:DEAD/DEAH box helicase family protein [Nocardioidaceae bacterium]